MIVCSLYVCVVGLCVVCFVVMKETTQYVGLVACFCLFVFGSGVVLCLLVLFVV